MKELEFLNSSDKMTEYSEILHHLRLNFYLYKINEVKIQQSKSNTTHQCIDYFTQKIRDLYTCKAMQFMQFSATKNALTSRKQNNPFISQQHRRAKTSRQVTAIHLDLKDKDHSFKGSIVKTVERTEK